MTNVDKISEVKINKDVQIQKGSTAKISEYVFFEQDNTNPIDSFNGTIDNPDWTQNIAEEFKKLGLAPYTWTTINGVEDAVLKSQDNLIDLIRYYEGHGTNYEAKTNYKDTINVSTYGFGLTTTAMIAIGNYDKKKKEVINKPNTQAKAYEQLLKYLTDITLTETKKYLGNVKYDNLPNSVKAALLDYHFKNGYSVMSKSDLVKKLETAETTSTPENWAEVLKELVYAQPASSKAEKVNNPGLYRRSLSRVILAAKGLKNEFPKDKDKAIIDKAVKEVYDDAIKCVDEYNSRQKEAKNKISTTDFDRIYNAYTGKIPNIPTTQTITTEQKPEGNKYKVPKDMGLFSAAVAIMPPNIPNDVDAVKLRAKIIEEIASMNGIKINGTDSSGYPNPARMLNKDEEIILPSTVVIGDKTIELKAPKDWELVSQKEQHGTVTENEPEAGTYIVKPQQGWWQIARDVAPDDYTEHQINTLQQQIAEYNDYTELTAGKIIKIPPENYVSPDEENSGENEDGNLSPMESDFAKMLKTFPYESKKLGNSNIQEVTFKYSLEKGENVYRIALNYGIDYKTLLSDNKITADEASKLPVGKEINIKKYAYSAAKDETIKEIAKKFGLAEELLKTANGNITNVAKGEKIEIPGFVYTAVKNDTWAKIAQKYSVTEEQLKKINGNSLSKNQKVFIPQNISSYQKINSDMPATAVSSSIEENVIKSLSNTGNRKYLKPEYVRYENGKVIATRVELKPTGSGKLNNKTIIVNAGHGLKPKGDLDPGNTASGTPNIAYEWLVAYDNAMRLAERLCAQGAKVIYIQGEETPDALASNEIVKKENKADLFISIHTNSSPKPPKDDRAEIFYHRDSKQSERLAEIFETKLDNYQNNKNYAQPKKCGYQVLRKAKDMNTPGILWEIAFHNNNSGRAKLADSKLMDKYSDMLTEAVIEYLNTPPDTRTRHTVKKGETLSTIAKQYNTTVEELKKVNGLRSDAIRIKQKLIIPEKSETSGKSSSSSSSANSTTKTETKKQNNDGYTTYKVKKGDTASKIAKEYGITVEQFAKLNNLKKDKNGNYVVVINKEYKVPEKKKNNKK